MVNQVLRIYATIKSRLTKIMNPENLVIPLLCIAGFIILGSLIDVFVNGRVSEGILFTIMLLGIFSKR